ncbi:MAG: branched-chain amino acid transport system substrate-binding protein [Methylobacteriaceae bacterium]|nr:branched-chain amino acid transport system substrate-binding protein [Methylobacteriaceae bacterium]
MLRMIAKAFAFVLPALAGAWLTPGISAAETKSIRIGVIQPMSGNFASYAQESEPAFEYIINKINAEGGIKSMGGAKIELLLADDASQGARTATEARRLATEENVAMIVGGLLSPQMLAISPVIDELKMPTLSMWAAGSKSDYLYSLGFPYDRGYAATMANFLGWLAKEKGYPIKNVMLVYSNYEAGQLVNAALKERLPKLGFNIAGEVALDLKAADQTAAMLRIRSMKPDATAGLVTPRDGTLLHQARFSLNYNDMIFFGGTAGFSDTVLWKDLGDQIGKTVLTRNLFGMTGFSPAAKLDSVRNIVHELKDKANLKIDVGQGAIQGAQSARILQRVLEAAGSTDHEAIKAAFAKVNIAYGDPDLYFMRPEGLAFAEDRLLKDSTGIVIQWMPDKSQEIVYPPSVATAPPRPKS